MASTIRLVQGDDLPGISFFIRDSSRAANGKVLDKKDPDSWRPVNLTGASVLAAISKGGANKQIDTADVVLITPEAGEVLINLNDCTFLDEPGQYDCEISVVFSGGRQTVYDVLSLDVRERIYAS